MEPATVKVLENELGQQLSIYSTYTHIGDVYLHQEQVFDSEKKLKEIRDEISTMLKADYRLLQLPIVPWLGSMELPLEDLYVDGVLTEIVQHRGYKTEVPTTMHDFFNNNDSSLRVFVKGDPGFGKTTLLYKLAYDWSNGLSYISDKFDLVFLIQLRYLNTCIEDVLCVLAQTDEADKNDVLEAIKLDKKKVLILLDGFDELPEKNYEYVLPLLCSKKFPTVTIVVTSRNGVLALEAKFWTKLIYLRGIQPEQQKAFLTFYFDSETESEEIIQKIQRLSHQSMETLFTCPLFLILLALLVSEDGGICIPKSKTQLYKYVFNFILRRSLTQSNALLFDMPYPSMPPTEEMLLNGKQYLLVLQKLGKLALTALINRNITFKYEEILESCSDEAVFQIGILKKIVKLSRRRTTTIFYEAVHTTFLEFLAAMYLETASKQEFKSLIENLFHDWDSKIVFNFLVGLLAGKCHEFFEVLLHFTKGALYFPFYLDLFLDCEQHTELLPEVLAAALPRKWNISWERHKNGFSKTLFHLKTVELGVKCNSINAVHYKENYVVELSADVIYPCFIVNCNLSRGIENDSNISKLQSVKCHQLILFQLNQRCFQVANLFFKSIQAQTVFIKMDSCNNFIHQLSQMNDCLLKKIRWLNLGKIANGNENWDFICKSNLKNVDKIKLCFTSFDVHLLNCDIIRNLQYLDLEWQIKDLNKPNEEVNFLLSTISHSICLKEVSLYIFSSETWKPIIDLNLLLRNRNHPLNKLKLREASLFIKNDSNIQINELIIETRDISNTSIAIEPILTCSVDTLTLDSCLLHQLVRPTDLNVIALYETLSCMTLKNVSDITDMRLDVLKEFSRLKNVHINFTGKITELENNVCALEKVSKMLPNTNLHLYVNIDECNDDENLICDYLCWVQHTKICNVLIISMGSNFNIACSQMGVLFTLLKDCLKERSIVDEVRFRVVQYKSTPETISVLYRNFSPSEGFVLKFIKAEEDSVGVVMDYAFVNKASHLDVWSVTWSNT